MFTLVTISGKLAANCPGRLYSFCLSLLNVMRDAARVFHSLLGNAIKKGKKETQKIDMFEVNLSAGSS